MNSPAINYEPDKVQQLQVNFPIQRAIINNQSNCFFYLNGQAIAFPSQQTVFAVPSGQYNTSDFLLSSTPPPYSGLTAPSSPMGLCYVIFTDNSALNPNAGIVLAPSVTIPPNVVVTNTPNVRIWDVAGVTEDSAYLFGGSGKAVLATDRPVDGWSQDVFGVTSTEVSATQSAPGSGLTLILTSVSWSAVKNADPGAYNAIIFEVEDGAGNILYVAKGGIVSQGDSIGRDVARLNRAAATNQSITATLSGMNESTHVAFLVSGITVQGAHS